MPQASEELRDEWGINESPAISFLKSRGYHLTRWWLWLRPKHHVVEGEVTSKERRAVQFLIEEWDLGGILPFGHTGVPE